MKSLSNANHLISISLRIQKKNVDPQLNWNHIKAQYINEAAFADLILPHEHEIVVQFVAAAYKF